MDNAQTSKEVIHLLSLTKKILVVLGAALVAALVAGAAAFA